MGIIGALKTSVEISKTFVFTIRAGCQWLFSHFIVLGAICVLFIVLILFPFVPRFFVSCLPILICTAVFVKVFLSFGSHDSSPNDQEKKKTGTSSSSNMCEFERREGFSIQTRLRRKKGIRERALEKSGIILGGGGSGSKEKKVAFSPRPRDSLMRRKSKIEAPDAGESFNDDSPSSPDTPPINVLPVIDEIDPLLDSEVPEVPEASNDDFDAVLESPDRSVDGSVDSEVENLEEKENEVDGATSLVTWTEDDEKNLIDLGTSELERNQRLENLIAKRRARKDVTTVAEKNLIDFESNVPQAQIPPITTAKSNPFDAPYSASETEGLPPIPSSAPSVFVPKKNPFDLPYDPQEEKPILSQDSFQQEFMSVFCRHESFNLGPSYMTGNKQEKYDTKFTPYFATEGMSSDGAEYSISRAQSCERRSSVFGAVPESDSLPPIDPKNRKKQMGRALSLGVYPFNHAQKEIKILEINQMKINQEVKSEASLDTADTKELNSHDTSEASFAEPEVVKEKNEESSVASSSEINEEVNDVKTEEVPSNSAEPEATRDLNRRSKEPSPPVEESDNNSRVTEGVEDAHAKEPVYDSSPSAIEKRTIDEYLVYPDKGPSLTSSSSIASDMHVEISEAGSPRYPYADDESFFHDEIDKNATESNSNSAMPVSNESTDKDGNEAPPSSGKPERHVEVHQQDSMMVDSMAPSPSSDLDKGESMTEEAKAQPSSHSDHFEESQEATLNKSTEEVSNIVDNVNEPLSNENKDDSSAISHVINQEVLVTEPVEATQVNHEESNGVHENTEVLANPSQPMESTMVDTETSRDHETTDSNVGRKPSEEDHVVDEASMQQHEEVGEKLQNEVKIDSNKTEVSNQDQD